ncbi:MAG TPA: NUDIX hydrolase [Candidatus Deferrimicrobiaceae bacterium]|nr:NUDIX hydrolase [Candidatus Deferrimicrobiaceae bacterium]
MPLKPWKKLSESVVFRNPYWTYRRDAFELPSGRPGEYHYVHTNGSSMVVPVLGDGTVLLVNQYRYLLDRESAEFPCGSVKDGSNHEETARQELAEEAGYSAEILVPVGEFNPYNGVTDEMCRVYVARDLRFVGGTPDATEEFELLRLSPAEVGARIRSGAIWDGMTIAAWFLAGPQIEGGG